MNTQVIAALIEAMERVGCDRNKIDSVLQSLGCESSLHREWLYDAVSDPRSSSQCVS